MSQWPASQLSAESGRAPTADELLVNVKQLIEQPQFRPDLPGRVAFSDKTPQYSLIISSLSDMLRQFPPISNNATKKDLDVTISLAHYALKAVERVSQRMEGAMAGEEYALTSKLVICLATIDEWEQSGIDIFEAPDKLRDHIVQVLTGQFALRVTETFTTERKYEDGLPIVTHCLEEVHSVLNSTLLLTEGYGSTYPNFKGLNHR